MSDSTSTHYYHEVDFIKYFAIISVVVLHIITFYGYKDYLYDMYATFYIWQAVPLFMLVIGFTFRLSIEKKHSLVKIFSNRAERLLLPLMVAYIIAFLPILFLDISPIIDWHIFIGKLPINGMGNYFISLYLETLVFFLFFYYIVKKYHQLYILPLVIIISILGELISYSTNIHDIYLYSASVHRYVLFITLGYYYYDYLNGNNKIIIMLGVLSGLLLLVFTQTKLPIWPYSEYNSAVLWGFQHSPYAFYTLLLALSLFYLYRHFQNVFINKVLKTIGNSSLHIFFTQMFIFNLVAYLNFDKNIITAIFIITSALVFGILWFSLENHLLRYARKDA